MMLALSGLSVPVSYAQLPAARALRQMALVQDELPKYLLAPEVSVLLHYVPDLHRRCCWRLSETPARALTKFSRSPGPTFP